MKKHENVDIIPILQEEMESNTIAYMEDLKYDIGMFIDADKSSIDENKRLLWLSRKCGTVCLNECDVYIKESGAAVAWQYYAAQKGIDEKFIAYAVEIKEVKDGQIIGNLHEFDYKKHVKHVANNEFKTAGIEVEFQDGFQLCIPYHEFHKEWDNLTYDHGSVIYQKHFTQDEDKLLSVVKEARQKREADCTKQEKTKLTKRTAKPRIRQQLSDERQRIAAIRATSQIIREKQPRSNQNTMEV